ncbi:sigma-70 family RNA polymerase sigma factor [Embleya sp. NPDC020886]|uniref:sigma-70 family RNA polymerase sigma factor n=1 Tax=Embleya sp. NPDC020886 TaxID=3363980 RepID=UPI0037BC9E84
MTEPRHPEQARAQAVDVDLVDLLPNDFVAFCHSHQATLTRFAYDHLGSRPEAEDLVADVLLTLYQCWDDVLREPAPPVKRAFRMLTDALEDRRLRRDLVRDGLDRLRPAPGGPVLDAPADFVRFYREHQQALTDHAWKHLGCPHDADEAVADVLLALSRRWSEIVRHPGPPLALAYEILRRRVVDIRRRRGRSPEVPIDFTAPGAPDVASTTASDPAALVPHLDTLDRTIAAMPAKRATCARLHLVMQLPLQDVADYLGVTISTVRSHVHAARKQLANALGRAEHHASAEATPPTPTHPREPNA